jgi:hypothetical protein
VDLLEKLLRKGNLNRLPKRFFWRAHWLVTAIPWMLVTTEDFRYREAVGKRPFGVGIVQWYIAHVSRVAAHDSRVVAEFLKVLHFMQTPAGLFKPYVLVRVIASMLGLYRGGAPHPEREYVRLPPGTGLQARLAHERGDGNNMTRPRKAAGARRKQATPAKSAGRSAARTGARAGKKSRARARA